MFGEVKEEADDDDEEEEGVEAKIDSTLQANVSRHLQSSMTYVFINIKYP